MIQKHNGRHLYSDHALLEFVLDTERVGISTEILKSRASNLGMSVYETRPITIQKTLRLSQCNLENVMKYFLENNPPVLEGNEPIDKVVDSFFNTVNDVLKENKSPRVEVVHEWGNQAKWTRLIESNDLRTIWKAVGWNGSIDETVAPVPTDGEFKSHFENLLNPDKKEHSDIIDVSDAPYIPVLDDKITDKEVCEAASCNENKSFVGVTPGILGILPALWISFLTTLLNMIFMDEHLTYPLKWCYNKLVVLFKKGARLLCGNYRGLSIGDTLGKLYGKIMCNRLILWMDVDKSQAGAQEKRGCNEHILALRLLYDYAKDQKVKLFVIFVDFSKAYDKVPRRTLFEILKNLGCGKRFLKALMAIYKHTLNILNSEIIKATIGVKQGGPMSCILFIIYLNVMVVMMKVLGNDSFLKDLHLMVLMDDTVLVASSREMIIKKFEILMKFCKEYGMEVNQLKTKLMVINGNKKDREEIVCNGLIVKPTKSYIYLGSPFTEDAKMKTVITMHIKTRTADLNKFKIFCKVNSTMPYQYKKKVLMAAILSSLSYSCESWITENLKLLEHMYIAALKSLLGVRETTRTDVVLLETGMPTIHELIRKRTSGFVKKNINAASDETPLVKVYKMCEAKGTGGYRFIKRMLDNPVDEYLVDVKQRMNNSASSKALKYKEINPELSIHSVYDSKVYIDERKRVTFSKFRTSSHSLKIETGRWARIKAEDRLCDCGRGVQDESHVVFKCNHTGPIREKYGINENVYENLSSMMSNHDPVQLVDFID